MDILDVLLDVFIDAVIDSLKLLPFLYLAYLLIEFLEHKASEKINSALTKFGALGAVGGALLGCVPQCGFSVVAANLYSGGLITLGTLIAVFISTSDEAIPVLLSHPEMAGTVWRLLAVKVVIAVIAGLLTDLCIRLFAKKRAEPEMYSEICEHCDCEHSGIWLSALRHTAGTFGFIFAVNLILGLAIAFIGEDTLSSVLLTDSFFQPFIAALVGFIPNCAASVILTELYAMGSLSFGSLIAGLCTGAGVGIVVLFKNRRKNIAQNIAILALLYAAAVLSGIVISLI